jgi:hypothetical protein
MRKCNYGAFVESFYRSPENNVLPAEQSGIIQIGDLLVAINHESVMAYSLHQISRLLSISSRPIVLSFSTLLLSHDMLPTIISSYEKLFWLECNHYNIHSKALQWIKFYNRILLLQRHSSTSLSAPQSCDLFKRNDLPRHQLERLDDHSDSFNSVEFEVEYNYYRQLFLTAEYLPLFQITGITAYKVYFTSFNFSDINCEEFINKANELRSFLHGEVNDIIKLWLMEESISLKRLNAYYSEHDRERANDDNLPDQMNQSDHVMKLHQSSALDINHITLFELMSCSSSRLYLYLFTLRTQR